MRLNGSGADGSLAATAVNTTYRPSTTPTPNVVRPRVTESLGVSARRPNAARLDLAAATLAWPMDDLTPHLERMLGPEATFREGQRDAIEAVTADGGRALVVQRTGWGKSLVYWIATRVRRDRGHGPTLIVS